MDRRTFPGGTVSGGALGSFALRTANAQPAESPVVERDADGQPHGEAFLYIDQRKAEGESEVERYIRENAV